MTIRRRLANGLLTAGLGMLAVVAAVPGLAQQPGGPNAAEAPKAQLFTPALDAPVAQLIMPPTAPAAATPPPATPPSATPPPAVPPPAAPPPAAPRPLPPVARPSAAPRMMNPGPAPAINPAAATDPVILAEAFYATYLQIRTAGVPNAAQRARLRPYLSPSLEAALAAAEKAEQDYHAKTKGAAPPLVEGDLFTSLFEGASSFAVKDCVDRPPVMECILLLTYQDPATKQKVDWQDTLVLARQSGVWRVHDIQYGGGFAFGQSGSLSMVLRILLKEAREQ